MKEHVVAPSRIVFSTLRVILKEPACGLFHLTQELGQRRPRFSA
jgi:hypothetical protein